MRGEAEKTLLVSNVREEDGVVFQKYLFGPEIVGRVSENKFTPLNVVTVA